MEERNVPYIAYEATQARYERTVKRLIVVLIITTVLLFASNVVWLYCWMQYDYTSSQDVTVGSRTGPANYIGNDGDIYNGQN